MTKKKLPSEVRCAYRGHDGPIMPSQVVSTFLCKIFIGQFFEERQALTHFSYRV